MQTGIINQQAKIRPRDTLQTPDQEFMGYKTLEHCVDDLRKHGHLITINDEVDAELEAAEIHRRVFQSGGPAILFNNVKNCQFRMVSNLFGTLERARFIFRDTLPIVKKLVSLKLDPSAALKRPWRHLKTPFQAMRMVPRKKKKGAVLERQCSISDLPQLKSWPDDGGAFVTLPQVYTHHPESPGMKYSNLGMYRVQISGGEYKKDQEVGLHYQIHRGIGIHHEAATRLGQPLDVNIFIGGTPAMSVAAVMPLPESMSELIFAGALAGHRIPMVQSASTIPIYGNADFCIQGQIIDGITKSEGPFGDHLGYYSLQHDFPVLKVTHVYHRKNAIWPFTVVGRPPQEDTRFGELIHEITGPVIPSVLPGVKAVHAVDIGGVHPLLLATGSERYTPYQTIDKPQELLTQANAILGQGQLSLAKYLWIIDDPCDAIDIHDIPMFLRFALSRVDWTRDLHFQTNTTIDTLDYSGDDINQGSKLVIAAAGPAIRELPAEVPLDLNLPSGYQNPTVIIPGILVIQGPSWAPSSNPSIPTIQAFCDEFTAQSPINQFPLVVVIDSNDSSNSVRDLIWTMVTKSNPAADIGGIAPFTVKKHWGCKGSLVIDARQKEHHAPPLIPDSKTCKRIDALASRGGELGRFL
ncbi:MAG: UbiD family decarboxylase [Pirellulaceae bacterium]